MPDAPEPHSVGRHQLGPHVVGKRVVVRHLLPDGRATDVLGVCTAWGADDLVVDREGSGPVRIRLADLVTGKPVPPRPSVRHRVPARDVELHVASLWPTLQQVDLGEWVLRHTPVVAPERPRKRGNSALAMGDPGLDLSEAADRVRGFYTGLGQAPLVQVLAGSELEAALAPLGFSALGEGDAHCLLAPVSRALRSCNRRLVELNGPRNGRPDGVNAGYIEEGRRVEVVLGEGMARGRAALDGDWLGLHELVVDQAHRRKGLGTTVVAELLDWGASQGATTAWLHVETDNHPALAAYGRLGFVTHHTNRYLVADGG